MRWFAGKILVALAWTLCIPPALGWLGENDSNSHAVQQNRPLNLTSGAKSVFARFPLQVSANQRYLKDSTGAPFLFKGDAAWSLIAQLERDEINMYLRDRRKRGFNAILVNLIEHKFARDAPANAYGDQPFLTPGRFDTPNEAYFAHADWVIQRAAEEGFVVLLAPCYTGPGGAGDGWYAEMVANGADRMRDYGRYVGQRFSKHSNIIWVVNGDATPEDPKLVEAVAQGLLEGDPDALQTAHNGEGTPGAEPWPNAPWLRLNNVYSYGPIFPDAKNQYLRTPTLPFILLESEYENGPNVSTQRLRRQAYHALLTGAAGQVFGNSPIWYFDGTDEYTRPPPGWQSALDSEGSRSMTHLHNLFARLPWQSLEPDIHNELLTGGIGGGHQRAVAARSIEGRLAVVYIPEDRAVTLDMASLGGARYHATWWDPTSGSAFEAKGPALNTAKSETFRPSVRNAAGDGDWILVLEGD
jgi:hypothetical protein